MSQAALAQLRTDSKSGPNDETEFRANPATVEWLLTLAQAGPGGAGAAAAPSRRPLWPFGRGLSGREATVRELLSAGIPEHRSWPVAIPRRPRIEPARAEGARPTRLEHGSSPPAVAGLAPAPADPPAPVAQAAPLVEAPAAARAPAELPLDERRVRTAGDHQLADEAAAERQDDPPASELVPKLNEPELNEPELN